MMTTKENVKNVPEEERNIFGNDQIGTITDNLYNRNIKNLRVPAFEGLGECVDYKTFFDAVDTYAKAFLEMGVKENDVVTLCLAGTLDAIINFYALNKIGAVANFVNPNYFKINSKKYINGTDSKLLIVMDRFYPILKDAISETDVEKVVLSSLTEYSSLLYKMMIKKQDIKKDQLIDGIDYYTLPEFIKMGEKSNKTIDKRNYVKEQPAALVYTSGSTGDPKGVLLTNDSFNNMISIYAEKDGFGSTVGDRNMLLIPPMYGTSLCHCINTPLAFGCTTVLQPIYNPAKFSEDLLKYEPKIVTASKAHYISLLRADLKKDQTKFLRMPFTGGEPITEKLATDINNRLNYLGSPNLMLAYGMSELGTMATINMDLENRVNESGYLLPHLKAKIVDPITGEEVKPNEKGDLLISSPCRMKEYYKNEEATSAFFITDADGTKWARTGDIATVSEDGVYNVIGRKKILTLTKKGKLFIFSK